MENAGSSSAPIHARAWMNASLSPDERAALLLAQMTLEEKISMFYEKGGEKPGEQRLGIPALKLADGPGGIRIDPGGVNEGKATAFPAPIALAATWDLAAAERYGDLVGSEAGATGHNVLLGPGLDIARLPVYGRLFEALGEDPVLTGGMAARYIQGVQRHPVVATAKHYNLNTQEENRLWVDARLDERTLQEIYTLPFQAAVQDGQVGSVMGALNKVNGTYCCENVHLVTEILREQLGFTGWVVSDFESTHSTVESANAGLDLEIPAAKFFGEPLLQAMQVGQVSVATIDNMARCMLRTMFAFGLFDHPIEVRPLPVKEHGQFAREFASQGMVLLKNDGGLLPLSSQQLRSLAVIGADADFFITGGGSAFVNPTYVVDILEGVRRRVGEGVQVEYAKGTDAVSPIDVLPGLPSVPSSVLTPADVGLSVHGLRAEYWTNTCFEGKPTLVRTDERIGLNLGFFNFVGQEAFSLPPTPPELNNAMSVRWSGNISVPVTGDYTLGLTHLGTARLFLDGRILIDDPGVTLQTQAVTMRLVADQPYALRIEHAADRPEQSTPAPGSSVSLIGAKLRFGWQHPAEAIPPAIQEAVALARRSDVALVVVRDYRSEHADLPGLTLPNEQDLLVQAVAAANPHTIVVVATGGPVLMPWLEQVPAALECWYGGQELGNALAGVLFGDVNPSGKLPVTFPRSERETPIFSPAQYSRDALVAHYSEGLAVGYRGYDQLGIEPLFPFGYGLSYTSFVYSDLRIVPDTSDDTQPIQINFSITNTGTRAGVEVAQVYLGLPTSANEPPRRLVGWAKVSLEPGESRDVSVTLDASATSRPLSYWNVKTSSWEMENGDYRVYVGASSRDICLTSSFHAHFAISE